MIEIPCDRCGDIVNRKINVQKAFCVSCKKLNAYVSKRKYMALHPIQAQPLECQWCGAIVMTKKSKDVTCKLCASIKHTIIIKCSLCDKEIERIKKQCNAVCFTCKQKRLHDAHVKRKSVV